jgi:hypothetical protein
VGATLAYTGQDPARYEHAPPPGFRRSDANGEVSSRLSFTAQAALGGDAGVRGFEAGLRLTF